MNLMRGGHGSQNAIPNNNRQPRDRGSHISADQLAVLSAAAAIIGVPVETLTSLRPNSPPNTTPYPPRPVPQTQDSAVDFWQDDGSFTSPHELYSSSINSIPSELQSSSINAESFNTSLEHETQKNWISEALPGDQLHLEDADHLLEQLSGPVWEVAPAQTQLAFLLQDDRQSLNPYANDQFSLSIQPATRIPQRIQPVYPQEPTEFLNIQQMQDFSDLFGDGPEYIDASFVQLFPDISHENAIETPHINTSSVSVSDRAGSIVISAPLPPSTPFVDRPAPFVDPNNQTRRQLVMGKTITSNLLSIDATGGLPDQNWPLVDHNFESYGFISNDGTASGIGSGDSLETNIASSSELTPSSWVVLTPPTPSAAASEKQSPKSSDSSIDQGKVGISPAERPSDATSAAVSTSMAIATSSNLYTLGPCTREWVVPKRRRKTARDSQNTRSKKNPALKDPDEPPRRRGKFKTEEEKKKTALTRELAACIRCRVQRIRCNPDPSGEGPCLTCARVVGSTMCKLPCLRYKLTAASLFRDQKSPSLFLSQRWQKMEMQDITEWASTETKIITMNSPNLGPGTFTLEVREFVPVEGDRMEEVHGDDGRSKVIKLPPYAMISLKKSSDQMRQHLKANIGHFISASIDEQRSPLIWYTYKMALNQAEKSSRYNEKKLLSNSLELWAAGRFWSNPLHIVGNETLGVDLDEDPSSPYSRVPEIPVMLAQSHIIMSAGVMGPLQRDVLHQLQTMVLANEKRNWLTIYLTIFLLLHSCAMITRRDEEYAREINLPTRFANPESITNLHIGALIILAHFHYCNKGKLPFSLADSYETLEQLKKIAELDEDQTMFVRNTSIYVHSVRHDVKKARENLDFGHDLYFVSQMFDEEWRPTPIG